MKSIIDYTNKLKDFFAQKQALSDEVVTRATLGAHNLVPFPFYEMSKSGYNVSFSVDSNGVVTADTNGQAASGSIALEVHRYQDGNCGMEPNVEYIVSGLDSGASASTYQIYVYSFLGSTHRESKEITSTGDNKIKFTAAFDGIEIYCRVQSGATLNDVKFYPMIRLATDTDPTYQPYAMTNRELTKSVLLFKDVACAVTAGNFATISNSDITADHVVIDCQFDNPAAIRSDVTWTTSNGSLVLNGTCMNATNATIILARKGN